jgi:hypothetical protein
MMPQNSVDQRIQIVITLLSDDTTKLYFLIKIIIIGCQVSMA